MTTAGEVLIYDAQGKRLRAMVLPEGAETSPTDRPGGTSSTASQAEEEDDDEDLDDESEAERKDGRGRPGSKGRSKGQVVSVDWYDGAEGLIHPRVPTLCIALEGGTVQLCRGTDDTAPAVVDASLTIRQVRHGEVSPEASKKVAWYSASK